MNKQPGYPIISYDCRSPLNEGEELIATLPRMVIQPGWYPFDFALNGNVRVEVKFASAPREIPYNDGYSNQFLWGQVKPNTFDWLLLTGIHEKQWWLWSLDPETAERYVTKYAQIAYTVPQRKQRLEAQQFDILCRTTIDWLRAQCSAASTTSGQKPGA